MPENLEPRSLPHPASGEPTDQELLLAVRERDEDAFEELMSRKTARLLGFVFRIVGEREEAKDIVQLVFMRVWEKSSRFDPRYGVDTWLYRIASNLAIDSLRSRAVRSRNVVPVRHHMRLVAGGREGDLEKLLAQEALAIVRDLASSLSLRQRQAFLLREVEGLSSKEVAEVLGCRQSTVRNHLFAARKYLRRELLARFPEYAAAVAAAARRPR